MGTSPAGKLKLVRCVVLALLSITALVTILEAQCPVTNPEDDSPPPLPTVTSSTRNGEPRLPESGYLTNDAYASTYFGFVINLPIPLEGHRVMMPLMPPGQHALLAIGFQNGRRSGTMLITASEPPNPIHEMTAEERQAEFQAWAKGEPRRMISPPDWLTRTGKFYHMAKHKGDVTTVQYWTFIKNYLIRVKVSSNDAGFLKRAKEAVGEVKFYCAQEDGSLINEKGEIVPTPGEGYQGPTIPNAIIEAALREKPALEFLGRGEIDRGSYRNDEMGLVYTYPAGWRAEREDSATPAGDDTAHRVNDVLAACSLLLLRLLPPEREGRAEAHGQITLRAVDQTCLGLPAPISVADQFGGEELGAYLQMLGVLGEVRTNALAQRNGQLFAEYTGVHGEHGNGDRLGERRVEAAAVTRHRKLLLLWIWIAPTPADLAAMPTTSVSLEGAAPITLTPMAVAKH